jgi:Arc/MetJ family transcription regulator
MTANERQADALRMRKAGRTFEEIAEALGYANASGAHKAVLAALRETLREPAEEYRNLHRDRLESIYAAYYHKAVSGDEKAAAICHKALADLAELDGLNAPRRVEQKLGSIDDRPIPLIIAATEGGE